MPRTARKLCTCEMRIIVTDWFALLLMLILSLASPIHSHSRVGLHNKGKLILPDAVSGLAYHYYKDSCPYVEGIVRQVVQSFLAPNISQAGSVVRLVFHDCFVQGCDASILLNDTNGEQAAAPNLTLRQEAMALVEEIKRNIEEICPKMVSCADILVLAGREAVHQAGGPFFAVPTGRLDGLNFASILTAQQDLPSPQTTDISILIQDFAKINLNSTDLVALSGAHTIGIAHCGSFNNSILPTVISGLQSSFAQNLLQVCPDSNSNEPSPQDPVTPTAFDNQYFKNLLNGQVLFNSDRALLNDPTTAAAVAAYAASQQEFFTQFAYSFVKMSLANVLTTSTGNGNIREVCSMLNPINNTLGTALNMMYASEDTVYQRA
eukprot:c38855_g1_i1 orf=122-1255(+)